MSHGSTPTTSAPAAEHPWWASGFLASGPFRVGFVTTLGVLLALLVGAAVASLSYALTLIFLAIFISLGLYPVMMIVYMQVESYVITPRIIGKAISIPSALVLIAAFLGATLLGLLGALVAAPLVASALLILKKVVVPRQNAT